MPAAIRLNKVLKELNISIDRAVDFLAEKGIEVDRRPTTKIDESTYGVLVEAFQKDARQKAASEEVVLSKIPEPERPKPTPVKEEPKPARMPEKKVETPKEEAAPKPKEVEQPKAETKAAEKVEPKETEKVSDPLVEKPVEPIAEKPIEEKKDETQPTEDETGVVRAPKKELSGLKTLGKIELPTKSNRPKKAAEKKREEKQAETKQTSAPNQAQPAKTDAKDAEKKTDAPKEEKATPPESDKPAEPEKIVTQYKKLDGPNFTGKTVDLSAFKKKEKPKSGDDKRKRKRISPNVKFDNRGGGGNRGGASRGRGRREPQAELTEEEVQKKIKETLEQLTNKKSKFKGAKHRRDKRKERQAAEAVEQERVETDKTLEVTEFVTVNELASLMDVAITDIISACMTLGVMVTMNQRMEAETIQLVAEEFGFEAKFNMAEELEDDLADEDDPADLQPRAPIVTVMGHVDHGKTSLLDYIRKANVIAGESGGITQHIGAYSVEYKEGHRITFLDTPGHEAFTAMRARGAQVTDLTIIVIAADDQVMPQTKEAISHAQAANVPMIFAINKIDKQGANPQKVYEQLAGMDLLVEEWGGKLQSQEISAKNGINIEELLEKISLEAEILELKANPNRIANGTVVEASLDKGRGYVSTVLIQNGTLRVGDYVLAGSNHGKVRAMLDERGKPVKEAGPSMPVTVLGLDGAPAAGDKFRVFTDEREAKQIASKREQLQREQTIRTQKHTTLDEIGRRIALGDFHELNIILKGDVDGSVEALTDSLQKLSTEEIQVNILYKGVGQITESDVLLATASDAIVIGFNVRPGNSARQIAEKEDIEIRTYSIIYDAINDVKEAMEGLLSPEIKEEVIGNVEIRETFKISKIGTIAGCMVLDGKITRNAGVRIIRDGVVVHEGELASLKRYQDDVREVSKGYECGLNIKNYNNIEVGDLIEAYEEVKVKKTL